MERGRVCSVVVAETHKGSVRGDGREVVTEKSSGVTVKGRGEVQNGKNLVCPLVKEV